MTTRRVLLDENLPVRLRTWLTGVDAVTVEFMGWKSVTNGDLVRMAQAEGFSVLVTADRLLAATARSWSLLGCVYLTSNYTPEVRSAADRIATACRTVVPGQPIRVQI